MKIIRINGGLGNQMFQYAFYLELKSRYKNVYCDISDFNEKSAHNGLELESLFDISLTSPPKYFLKLYRTGNKLIKKLRKTKLLRRYDFHDNRYLPELILNSESAYYSGYWQSESYFFNVQNKIRNIFQFKVDSNKKNIELINFLEQEKESVSIHIRRGDYIAHNSLGGLTPISYYEDAITLIKKKLKTPFFIVFSNDINWCRENFDFLGDKVIFVDWNFKESSYMDMVLMSKCKHNIIANSSFSWWGAWLNENKEKLVIAPKKWFTDESGLDYNDMIPENWIKVKNY